MATYLGSGDASRQRRDYRPEWLDRLAADVTLEASVLNGIVTGADAVRTILGHARTLYDYQEFEYVGPYGDAGGEPGDGQGGEPAGGRGFVEDYTARVHGEPIGSIVVVRFNDAGETQYIVINHRPLGAVLLWSRLMGEHFAGTEYARYFLTASEAATYAATEGATA